MKLFLHVAFVRLGGNLSFTEELTVCLRDNSYCSVIYSSITWAADEGGEGEEGGPTQSSYSKGVAE